MDKRMVIIHRSSEDMHEILDGKAELLCTSPPYWGMKSQEDLILPRNKQNDLEKVSEELKEYTETLKPIYHEMIRILHPLGALIFQIKDIRYGGFSIPLSHWHCELLHSAGFRLLGKINWMPKVYNPQNYPAFFKNPKRANWHPLDTEQFLVFSTKKGLQEPRIPEN